MNLGRLLDIQEFRIIVIKLIAGLEKRIEDSRESIATEIKRVKYSHDELKNAINEVQNKMEMATAGIEEAEGRIGELEDNSPPFGDNDVSCMSIDFLKFQCSWYRVLY